MKYWKIFWFSMNNQIWLMKLLIEKRCTLSQLINSKYKYLSKFKLTENMELKLRIEVHRNVKGTFLFYLNTQKNLHFMNMKLFSSFFFCFSFLLLLLFHSPFHFHYGHVFAIDLLSQSVTKRTELEKRVSRESEIDWEIQRVFILSSYHLLLFVLQTSLALCLFRNVCICTELHTSR